MRFDTSFLGSAIIGSNIVAGESVMPMLEFKGKQHIYAHHLTVPYRPLVADPRRSLNPPDADDNLIIHGDNLHALKALLPRHAGRVKCIYIDPPYNTGNEGWIYNDNVNSPLMREWVKANNPVDGEDLERSDKWLCLMWPRLHLLRELLTDNGVIFVSIDSNEHHHLRMILDEVFGEGNFIADIVVVSNLAGSSDQFGFAGAHEYCLVYAKNRSTVALDRFAIGEEGLAQWQLDEKGHYRREQLKRGSLTYSESLDYPIFVGPEGQIAVTEDDEEPETGGPYDCVYPTMSNGNGIWRWSKTKINQDPTDVIAEHRKDGSIVIYSKQRPQLGDLPTEKPKSVFYKAEYSSRAGGRTLSEIFPESSRDFPYPKAVTFVADLISIGAAGPNDIVLDSFAGSGTTAQAILTLNKEDGGNRNFILVECEDYADTITAERVRRVINGVPGAKDASLREGLGGSFTYCTLGDPIDVEGMLTGEALPGYSELAAYLLHTASGLSANGKLEAQNDDGLFYRNGDTDYYLLYHPDIEWLRSNEAILDEEQAQRIRDVGRIAVVFASDKYMGQRFLSDMGIVFCQIPYELHRLG